MTDPGVFTADQVAQIQTQLGASADLAVLGDRYTTLLGEGKTADAALTQTIVERLQTILSGMEVQSASLNIAGEISYNNAANITALRAKIDELTGGVDPDGPDGPLLPGLFVGNALTLRTHRSRSRDHRRWPR